jgi:hypothetical protein
MVRFAALGALLLLVSGVDAAAQRVDPLAQARTLYNQRDYSAALNAADQARATPARADSADLIAARAYLERFRESGAADDLDGARERLRRLDPQRLAASERTEFIIGLGEALYFDGSHGAAADVFESLLARPDPLMPEVRESALDWWATAVDREARGRPDADREARYERIRERMAAELGAQPGSSAASYWLAAAARGLGDVQAAWAASLAAWVRAPMATDRGAALRADIDRLVLTGLVAARAKSLAKTEEQAREEWEAFKARWTK